MLDPSAARSSMRAAWVSDSAFSRPSDRTVTGHRRMASKSARTWL